MSTNFGVMKTNCGNNVQDTSTAMKTLIGVYINNRLEDIRRRANFSSIALDENLADFHMTATSASTVTSASTYALPSDFGKELYVYNSGTGRNTPRMTLSQLEQEYQGQLADAGTVEFYSIISTKNTSATSAEASAARVKKIKFWRAPTTDNTFTIPYITRQAALSADSDEVDFDCEQALQHGATADAWTYKRQFAKAKYYESLYEKSIQALIWDHDNQPNYVHLMNVRPLSRNEGT